MAKLNDLINDEINKADDFNIESRYQFYLKKVQLREEHMSHNQRIETRRAFYGGAASLFDMLTLKMAPYDEDKECEIMDFIQEQIIEFFNGELNK